MTQATITDGGTPYTFSYSYDPAGNGTDYNDYYYHYNAQGDVVAVTDKDGKVYRQYVYDPYGNLISVKDGGPNGGSTVDINNDQGFNNAYTYRGYRYDSETGLYFLNSRYYVPGIGRFLTKDSVIGQFGNPATLNQYAYCLGDPVNYIDPTGQSVLGDIFTGIATGAEAIGIGIGTAVVSVVSIVVGSILYYATPVSSDDWDPGYTSGDSTPTVGDAPSTVDVGSGGGGGGGAPRPPKKKRKLTDGHHVYPTALARKAIPVVIQLLPTIHRQLHSLLYQFEGGWLAPTRVMTGEMILRKYGAERIQQGLMDFYSQYAPCLVDPLKQAIELINGR